MSVPLAKDIGKAGSDLLNKDFQDDQISVELKTVAGGTTFNPKFTKADGTAAFAGLWKSTCPVCKDSKLEYEHNTSGVSKFVLSNEKLVTDVKLSGTYETDKDHNRTVKAGADIKKPSVAASLTVSLPFAAGAKPSLLVAVSTKKGLLTVGGDVDVNSDMAVTAKNVALNISKDNHSVTSFYKSKGASEVCSLVYLNGKAFSCGAQLAGEISVDVSKSNAVKLAAVAAWTDNGANYKLKLDSAGVVRAVYSTKFNTSTKLTLGSNFDLASFTASKFGVGLLFE